MSVGHDTLLVAIAWPGAHDTVLQLLRWIHFFAGIVWIGHLYFFNLVQGPFEKVLDGDARKKVVPELRPRALWWFRWGAMITMLSGVLYLLYAQAVATDTYFRGWFDIGKNWWITLGSLLGLIMWFNVWFIIWPNQRVIIEGIKTGNKAPDHDARVRVAFLASRFNTYVSVPMLFGMGGASHFPTDVAPTLILMPVVLLVGLGIAHFFIGLSGKVGTEWSSGAPAAPPAAK